MIKCVALADHIVMSKGSPTMPLDRTASMTLDLPATMTPTRPALGRKITIALNAHAGVDTGQSNSGTCRSSAAPVRTKGRAKVAQLVIAAYVAPERC